MTNAGERSLVVLQGAWALQDVHSALTAHGMSSDTATVTSDPAMAPNGPFSSLLLLLPSPPSPALLGSVTRLLVPGASAVLQLRMGGASTAEAASSMLLGGFADCVPNSSGDVVTVTARLPAFAMGSSDSLRRKSKAAVPAAAAAPSAAWLLSADDQADADELIDDEELLTEEDRRRPAVSTAQDDCEVGAGGARKACKNCTCGRAEAEAAGERVTLTQEMLDNPQSSCGNCSLGDAFRCAGCPYRGLPAFEPGKKIQLSGDFLTADA